MMALSQKLGQMMVLKAPREMDQQRARGTQEIPVQQQVLRQMERRNQRKKLVEEE